jgi:drug/metabolite transporter (DMT)-like permease
VTEEAGGQSRVVRRVGASPTTWLAWLLWIAILVFGASLLELSERHWFWYVLTHPLRSPGYLGEVLSSGILIFAVPAYSTVGAIVASLRPKNGVGWLCLALSLFLVLGSWQPENVALRGMASILSGLAFALTPLTITLLLLIFPDGRLPSRRWWAVVGIAVGGLLLGVLTELLPAYPSATELVAIVALSIVLVALAASAVGVVLRWRRSRDQERQQIKLLVYAIAVTVVAILSALTSSYVLNDIPGAESYPTVLATVVALGGIALGIKIFGRPSQSGSRSGESWRR